MKLSRKDRKIKIACLGLILILSLSIYFIYQSKDTSLNTKQFNGKIVSESEKRVLKDQHPLLSKSEKVVSNSTMYSYAHKFQIDKELERKIKLPGDDSYSYYNNSNQSNIIKGEFIVDTKLNGGTIKLIFLQGNKTALIKSPEDSQWYSTVTIHYKEKSTTIIPLEIMWDIQSNEELTVIPIHSEKHYDGSYLAVSRYAILNSNELDKINAAAVHDNLDINQELLNDPNISVFPFPKLYDNKMNELTIRNKSTNFIATNPPQRMILDAISFNTKIDIIFIDQDGKIERVIENIDVIKGYKTEIDFEESLLEEINAPEKEFYVLITNNRNREMIADMNRINELNQPYPTTFSLIIKFYKSVK
ncbi:hypothetical protein M3650_23710 [Paenibacillus sp. MER TA 81-3]|uniref:hypothetical protein n=1 Tax=Paenibacillus sp. MER TA 81-3 TaxID=2939573 RepID=UPI00203DA832|nr:hypothetical protein [Paenibacillus sp. MER TA 81-3]MCM3341563.1 hypothetical protein [Paenibacillus sp. MER TA 81-3]